MRILSLLPGQWRKELTAANGDIVIRVHTDEDTTTAQIRVKVTAALSAPEVSHWELAACDTVTVDPDEFLTGGASS